MKTGIVTTLIALCLPVSVFATTLRLSTDVDLLVLDGKKVSSSLLRGADSIELDNGPHQLVFRVEKTIHLSNSEERLYISPPLVVSFNTQLINQVNFRLPRLENEREANHFYVKRCIPYRIGTEQHLGCSSCLALAQIKERQHNTQDQQRRTSRYHHSADGLNAFGKV